MPKNRLSKTGNDMRGEQREKLIKNILLQAKYFLDNADEFYPFGATLDKNNNIRPIGVYIEQEHPESPEVYTQLENAVNVGIRAKEYQAAAIALDVLVNLSEDKNVEKQPAVQIKLYSDEMSSSVIFLYFKNETGYTFKV